MPLDCYPDSSVFQQRQYRGKTSYLAGLAAEESVVRDCEQRGLKVVARRWRGKRGEIDIVARDGKAFVFVEVKKSRTHAQAAEHLGFAQQRRLWASAEEFLAMSPYGSLSDVRFDVALVDATGAISVIENALTGF